MHLLMDFTHTWTKQHLWHGLIDMLDDFDDLYMALTDKWIPLHKLTKQSSDVLADYVNLWIKVAQTLYHQ